VNGGKKGKNQGIEGSANANDVWLWMKPHIGFCTIGKCDLLSFVLSVESLPAACKFHLLFFLLLKHGASSYEVSPLLLFNPCSFFLFLFSLFFLSLFFSRILLLGTDSTHWNFLGESLGK
jgi:hypothetical protein